MPNLEDVLQHHGIKGMRWGVRRDRNRPGGADGKEESTKVNDKRGQTRKKLDSMKRERDWKKVLKEMDSMSTADINTATKRIRLENDMKRLTKSVGKEKDKNDYLNRAKMSNDELNRKVTRLRAKDGLKKSVQDASKEQREFGQKLVQVGGTLGMKYALTKSVKPKDLFDALNDPKEQFKKQKEKLQESVAAGK